MNEEDPGYAEAPDMTPVATGNDRLEETPATATTSTNDSATRNHNKDKKTEALLGDEDDIDNHKRAANTLSRTRYTSPTYLMLMSVGLVTLLFVVSVGKHRHHNGNTNQSNNYGSPSYNNSTNNRTRTTNNNNYNNRHNNYWGYWGNRNSGSRTGSNSNYNSNRGSSTNSRYSGNSGSSYSGNSGSRYSGSSTSSYSSGRSSYSGGRSYSSCFPPGELVELISVSEDMNTHIVRVPIEQVQPGNVTVSGGKVTAIMKLLFEPKVLGKNGISTGETMYRYNDSVCVTGSHSVPVFINDQRNNNIANESASWQLQRVEDSPLAVEDLNHRQCGRPPYLYSLVTEHHLVKMNGTLLADWEETNPFSPNDLLELLNRPTNININQHLEPEIAAAAAAERKRELLVMDHTLGTPIQDQDGIIPPQPVSSSRRKDTSATAMMSGDGAFASGTLVDIMIREDGDSIDRDTAMNLNLNLNVKRSAIPIEDVEPGTLLADNCGVVVARVNMTQPEDVCQCHDSQNHQDANLLLWKYNNTIITSPWTMVQDHPNGRHTHPIWRFVKDSPLAEPVTRTSNAPYGSISNTNNNNHDCECHMYQLVTSTHQIPMAGGAIFADYEVFDS